MSIYTNRNIPGGPVDVVGGSIRIPEPPEFLAVITGGSNPYSFREVWFNIDESEVDVLFEAEAGFKQAFAGPDSSDDTFDMGRGAERSLCAYERFGNKDVYPGTVVVMKVRQLRSDDQYAEFEFAHRDGPVAAKVTVSSTTTTLGAAMDDSQTTMEVTSWSTPGTFPYRKSFRVKIDDEVIEVDQDTSSTTRNVKRAQDGTEAAAHDNSATVTLCDAYAWTEQRAVKQGNDQWEDRPDALTGTDTAEPARERNQACSVPDGTFVLVRRKGRDGAGSSSTTSELSKTTTSVPISSRTSFPQRCPFYIRVDGEFMQVTDGAGTGAGTFTVVRGQYLSPATRHESGNSVVEAICEWVFDYCCGKTDTQNQSGPDGPGGGAGGKFYSFCEGGAISQTAGADATVNVTLALQAWARPVGYTYKYSDTVRIPLTGIWQINYNVEGSFTFGDVSSELPFEVDSDITINDVEMASLHDCKWCASLIYSEGSDDTYSSGQSETADFDHYCLGRSSQLLLNKGDILKITLTNNSTTDASTIDYAHVDGFYLGK